MKKLGYELEFDTTDLDIHLNLNEEAGLEARIESIDLIAYFDTSQDGLIEAFGTDEYRDWEGLNGYELDDYREELNKISNDIEEYIKDKVAEKISDYIDDKIISITDSDAQPLTHEQLDKHVKWVTVEYYKHYSTTLSCSKFTNKTAPYINFICYSPVRGSSYVLICELCNVHFLKKGE